MSLPSENVVDDLTSALTDIATHLKSLGLNDAATEMGAIEYLATEVRDGSARLADALEAIAEAIRDHTRAVEGVRE